MKDEISVKAEKEKKTRAMSAKLTNDLKRAHVFVKSNELLEKEIKLMQ